MSHSHSPHDRQTRPDGCPLCGSSRLILTHSTESVHLWRCQRCGLQWPTMETEAIDDQRGKSNQKT